MEIFPILFLVFFWMMFSIVNSAQKRAKKSGRTNHSASAPAEKQPEAEAKAEEQPEATPARETRLAPSVFVTEHDDTVYQGSMNAVTGEGTDPCHDEQMAPLSAAEAEVSAAPAPASGLQLRWTGDEVVRGFVMSEILRRK